MFRLNIQLMISYLHSDQGYLQLTGYFKIKDRDDKTASQEAKIYLEVLRSMRLIFILDNSRNTYTFPYKWRDQGSEINVHLSCAPFREQPPLDHLKRYAMLIIDVLDNLARWHTEKRIGSRERVLERYLEQVCFKDSQLVEDAARVVSESPKLSGCNHSAMGSVEEFYETGKLSTKSIASPFTETDSSS